MTEHEKPLGHLLVGILIGSAFGTLAGILFAPKSGRELRSEIMAKRNALLKDAKNIYDDASTKASRIVEEATHQAMALKEDADRHFAETRQKTKEILAHGENKHAEAGVAEK